MVQYADRGEGIDLLKQLLEKGLQPNDQENGGCSHIQRLLNGMEVDYNSYSWCQRNSRDKIDSPKSREKIRAIHLLAKHGGMWVPKDNDIKHATVYAQGHGRLYNRVRMDHVEVRRLHQRLHPRTDCDALYEGSPLSKTVAAQEILAAWPGWGEDHG